MFFRFFRKQPQHRKTVASRRLGLEALESRDVPTATLSNGILTITPTDGTAVVNATTTVQIINTATPHFEEEVVVTRTTPSYTQTQSFSLYGLQPGHGSKLWSPESSSRAAQATTSSRT